MGYGHNFFSLHEEALSSVSTFGSSKKLGADGGVSDEALIASPNVLSIKFIPVGSGSFFTGSLIHTAFKERFVTEEKVLFTLDLLSGLLCTETRELKDFGFEAFNKQHCLYFFPEPQGQGSFLPIFCDIRGVPLK